MVAGPRRRTTSTPARYDGDFAPVLTTPGLPPTTTDGTAVDHAGMRHAESAPRRPVAVCPDMPEFDGWLIADGVVDLANS